MKWNMEPIMPKNRQLIAATREAIQYIKDADENDTENGIKLYGLTKSKNIWRD